MAEIRSVASLPALLQMGRAAILSSTDVISTLIYDSKGIFVKELQVMLAVTHGNQEREMGGSILTTSWRHCRTGKPVRKAFWSACSRLCTHT